MNGWMKLAAALFAAASFAGCSLLKVAVATGDPLSKEQMNVRTMTRGFYYDMAGEVARAADSIVAASPDVNVRVAAVRWKIRATRAGVTAAMQGIPDVALADLWILCRRMNEGFAQAPDSLLFGLQSDIARDAALRLDRRAGRLARQVLPDDRYALMERFVTDYVRDNPASEGDETDNTTLAWLEYLRAAGVEQDYATGSIAEVLADVNDRLSGQTQQVTNSVSWSKDIFEMRLRQDSLRLQVGAQLDRLAEVLQSVVVVAQTRARDGAVGVGLRVDGIEPDGRREIVLGAQQVVEVVFGDAAQEIAFEGILVEPQQGVERPDGLLVVVVHHARTSHPEEIFPVVLRIRFLPAHQCDAQCDPEDVFFQFPTHLSH